MSLIEFTLRLNEKEYPMLNNLKKKELDKFLLKIFKTGYQIHFPSQDKINHQVEYNEIVEKIENIKDEIKDEIQNSEINNKLNTLESSLSKLIGLSSNSCKKGNFGENILEEIFNKRYGDIQFDRKSHVAHSGDAWLYLPDNKVIMLESKNYTTTINKEEIVKLQSDMINHHIKWGILTSFNSGIQGMKELDFHTFNHNNETYFVIMISNLSTDIHKLDLGLQIIRKLMASIGNLPEFPWVVKDITHSLNELNQIILKNYFLRDAYYNMERDIQKILSGYHINLRDYQYDIEQKINEIIGKIKSNMSDSIAADSIAADSIAADSIAADSVHIASKEIIYQNILAKYQDKKILPIVVRIVDLAQSKKWTINYDETNSDWLINTHNINNIGRIKIQQKKVIVSIPANDLTLTLNIGKEKENKKNIEIIKSICI